MRAYSLTIETEYFNQPTVLHPSVIYDKGDVFLVDCGYEGCLNLIEQELEKRNLQIQDLTGIIITHDDIDHIGGLYELKSAHPTIKIYASEIEKPYLEGKIKSLRLKQVEDSFNTLPKEYESWAIAFQNDLQSIKRVPVDVTIGLDLPISENIQIINTPGHTPGHISIYLPENKILIAGDALVIENGELEIANPQFTLDLEQAIASVEKLAKLDIHSIYCFHGGLVSGNIEERITGLLKKYKSIIALRGAYE